MQSKVPNLTARHLTSKLIHHVAGLVIVFAWTCITPALFGQHDAHAGLISAANRESAPAFQLMTETGKKVRISDYRGKVLLVDFWATKCGGCVLEIPSFIELEKEYKHMGFTAVGVSMDTSYDGPRSVSEAWSLVKPFVVKHGVNYTIVMGDDAVTKAYALNMFPATYLIDKSGRVAVSYVGILVDKDNVAKNIRSLLLEQ